MASNYQRTADWLKACGKVPGSSEDLSVQIGVDLEEIAEYLQCLRVSKTGWTKLLERLVVDMEDLAGELKRGEMIAHFPNHMRPDLLDALCDREVTANGVAYLAGFDKHGADQEVLRANDSKLENGQPVLLPGGKVGKGKNYAAPDLRRFV